MTQRIAGTTPQMPSRSRNSIKMAAHRKTTAKGLVDKRVTGERLVIAYLGSGQGGEGVKDIRIDSMRLCRSGRLAHRHEARQCHPSRS